MYIIDKNIINRIINETDLVELINEDIDLNKKGSNFVGLCPFHQDNNPSFTVSPTKHIYKCFVCEKGGNAITYLQDKRNLSYQDGVAYLASKLNIQIKMEKKSEAKKEHILLG
ncbi:MAG: CHC2 zinc finger domain-containing protein, partial [Mycoplasmatales bacterium]